MKVIKVNPDGHCMFRSVAQAIHAADTGMTLTLDEEASRTQELRTMVAQYIRKHPVTIMGEEHFLLSLSNAPMNARGVVTNVQERARLYAPIYAQKVQNWNDFFWGGPLELAILSHLLRRKIHVFNSSGTRRTLTVTTIRNTNFRYNEISIAHRPEVHYDALVPTTTRVIEPYPPKVYKSKPPPPKTQKDPKKPPRKRKIRMNSPKPNSNSRFKENMKIGHIQSLTRLGANKDVLLWAKQSPFERVQKFHADQRLALIAALQLRKNLENALTIDDDCKHLLYQEWIYKKHGKDIPSHIKKKIKNVCGA
jgi:hypothetical protein